MTNDQIKEIALANGFKLKEQPSGEIDLNPYVYDFARALFGKVNPICPYCESEIDNVLDSHEVVYDGDNIEHECPQCDKNVGLSVRVKFGFKAYEVADD